MAPLLSIPTAVKEVLFHFGILYLFPVLLSMGAVLWAATLVARRLIPQVGYQVSLPSKSLLFCHGKEKKSYTYLWFWSSDRSKYVHRFPCT